MDHKNDYDPKGFAGRNETKQSLFGAYLLNQHAPHQTKPSERHRKKVAVIGSGIAGLSAAWHLSNSHEVTVFEANDYLGGHTHTVDIDVEGISFPVDTGFIVCNPQNYPNLMALFDTLNVETRETDMSFSASLNEGSMEYAGGDSGGLLAQPSNLLKPRFWSMVLGILRFYRNSVKYVGDEKFEQASLGDLLSIEGYSEAFIQDHLTPMGAAIWSSDSGSILDYPAKSFLRFFNNHGLTQIANRPTWRTVVGGSRTYVEKIYHELLGKVKFLLSTPVVSVAPEGGKVNVRAAGGAQVFDQVVMACHSDQSLAMIRDSGEHERVLEPLKYAANKVVLHSDTNLMPKRKKAWASWNYIDSKPGSGLKPAVSYWMNQLQDLPVETPTIVTLNPNRPIDPTKIYGVYEYDHPVFDKEALLAKEAVWQVQGNQNIWLCGAYLGDGFHEDGIQSGLAVAENINGIRRPWMKKGQNSRIGFPDLIPLNVGAD